MSDCGVCIGGYDGDAPEFCEVIERKARKEHKCHECRSVIARGERYEYISGKYDGDLYQCKTCQMCREIRDVFSCGKGFIFEALWDDMREYVFPELTTANKCFQKLGPAAKEMVLSRWRTWKGIQ